MTIEEQLKQVLKQYDEGCITIEEVRNKVIFILVDMPVSECVEFFNKHFNN